MPDIRWNELEPGRTDNKQCELLLEMSFNNILKQIVSQPTREESVLNLVFVSSTITKYNVAVQSGLSDHEMVLVSCKVNFSKNAVPSFQYKTLTMQMTSVYWTN